jgi:hypothetical protein
MTPNRESQASPALAIEPAVYAADSTPPAVDMLGYGAANIALAIGVGGITFTTGNKIEFVLTHSADGVTYAPVEARHIITDALAPGSITGGIVRALTAAHAAADVQRIGYIGQLRYLKLLADFSGTHATGTPISATVSRARPALSV